MLAVYVLLVRRVGIAIFVRSNRYLHPGCTGWIDLVSVIKVMKKYLHSVTLQINKSV